MDVWRLAESCSSSHRDAVVVIAVVKCFIVFIVLNQSRTSLIHLVVVISEA